MSNSGVEYAVNDIYFDDPDKALLRAVHLAIGRGKSTLDVIVYSEEGAMAHGGDDAVREYLEDPEASVFERIEIKVNNLGRVP